ncbi:MAG TPA: winged helix-turn-helix domain-containing protein, partial [Blastocatellia bacterium]|nr:winged helix-turn-helix domain-containing protein [Blastocatellia bacterium]
LLLHEGKPVSLTPKVFDLLLVLVKHQGRLLEKDELMRAVWPDTVVEEANLSANISILRKALGDGLNGQSLIETVPKRGYRFIAPVREEDREESPSAGDQPSDSPMTGEESKSGARWRTASRSRLLLSVALILLVAAAGIAYLQRVRGGSTRITSLAVLPFKPIVEERRDEAVEMGITESLITKLHHIQQIRVRPLSAVRRYGSLDQDPLAAGRALGVDAVIDGSIQWDGQRKIRVIARLLRVEDGSLLWTNQCEEDKCQDIFALQDSISERVASSLASELTRDERKLLAKHYTRNTEAYQLYLRGRYFWNRRTEEGFKKALDYFQQAVQVDPNYALAHVGLADCYLGLTFYSYLAPHQAMPQAKSEAMKALEIDGALAEALTSLAHVRTNYEWDWPAAERAFKQAIQLAPDYATAHQWYAAHCLTPLGRSDAALREMRLARELEPLSLVMNSFLGSALYFSREYDQAIEQSNKTLELDPSFGVGHWHLGLAYLQKRRFADGVSQLQQAFALSGGSLLMKAALGQAYAVAGDRLEATKILDELKTLSQQRYVPSSEIAAIYVGLGEHEQAFQWLSHALEERAFHLIYLKARPEFNPLHSDPRFAGLLRRIGLEK